MALKTMFATLKKENAKNSFGNIIAVANESAEIRDTFMEEMDTPIEVDLNDPDAEEKFKDAILFLKLKLMMLLLLLVNSPIRIFL